MYLANNSFHLIYKINYQLLLHCVLASAEPIPGIYIGIGPIPVIFNSIGICQACYTSTNSVVCALLSIK